MAAFRLLQPTTTVFPASQATLQSSAIPLGVLIQPLSEGRTLPVVSYGLKDVTRCVSCGGYLNPFVVWVSSGHAWMCPLCKARNAVSEDFYQPLNEEGRRIDEAERADLTEMEYEVEAPESYIERTPVAPSFCFLLDCSEATHKSGLLAAFCSVLEDLVSSESFPGLPRTQLSFVLFTSEVHLVTFCPSSPSVSLISLSRATDTAFLPVPLDRLLVTVADTSEAILAALRLIRSIGEKGNSENTAMRMALMYAHSILHGNGGRAVLVVSDFDNSPHWKQGGKDGFPNYDPWYLNIAKEFRSVNIACDLFLSASRQADLVSVGYLAESSNGQLFFYPNLTPAQHAKVSSEAYLSLTRQNLWDAAIRLRVNSDWKVVQAYGSFHIRAGDLFTVPCFDSSQAILYRLELDESSVKQGKVYLQAAILYTTDEGERRIRVINGGFRVSTDSREVIGNCIQENVACMWAKQSIIHSLETSDSAKFYIENQLKSLISVSKQLPANLAFLPYYIFGLTKLPLFFYVRSTGKASNSLLSDQTAFVRYIISGSPSGVICHLAYPKLYSLSNMLESGEFEMQPLNLSINSLSKHGIFFLDTLSDLYMWAGPEASAETLAALFGNALRVPSESDLSERTTPQAEQVKEVISRLRCQYGRYQTLSIFTHGNPNELQFFAKMIEDGQAQPPTFAAFLASL